MVLDPGFTTAEMSEAFSAKARVAAFLRFEAALASAQADLGIIHSDAAAEISRVCDDHPSDPVAILADGWRLGTPVAALLDWLRPRLSPSAMAAVHRGVTTQDVVDTATMLQVKVALGSLAEDLESVTANLARLAHDHRATPTRGRTLLQEAVVTSFGARAALWLAPLITHRRRMNVIRAELPLQLGGPVGDAAGFDGHEAELADILGRKLRLRAPVSSWHTDRTPVSETLGLVGRVATAMAKIGSDIALLAQPALGEVRVRSGRSSSMPGKSNPIDAVRAIAAARVCHAAVAGVVGAPPHELERSIGSWQAEWVLVPTAFQAAGAAVEAVSVCLGTLDVDVERMGENAGGGRAPDSGVIDRVLADLRSLEDP